jgi:hypothetical protein
MEQFIIVIFFTGEKILEGGRKSEIWEKVNKCFFLGGGGLKGLGRYGGMGGVGRGVWVKRWARL